MYGRRGGWVATGTALALLLSVRGARAGSLAGWEAAVSNPQPYEVAVDDDERHSGGSSAFIGCASCESEPPAALLQTVRAEAYRGRRVRLAAYVKSVDVRLWAGLWMRVDEPGRRAVAFDNMSRRPISGTTAWTRYEVVLEVSAEAAQIAFGVLLAGPGQVWADDFSLTAVEASVASTDLGFAPDHASVDVAEDVPSAPRNLSFEE